MIVVAVASIFFMMAYSTISGVIRLVTVESSVLEMDRDANQALQELADALRPSILPIPVDGDAVSLNEFTKAVLQSKTQGFDTTVGRYWLEALQSGTDCIAFTVPVDFGNDGDTLDADLYLELGMVLPSGQEEYGADYDIRTNDQNYLNGNPVNRFLRDLNPRSHLGLETGPLTLATGSLPERFAADFALPDGDRAYAIARFVPHYADADGNPNPGGAPMAISENDILNNGNPAIRLDLNGDGDTDDTFLVGSMELVYSNVRYPISGPDVLLQTNQDDAGFTPIFQLVRFRTGDESINNNVDGFNPLATEGEYGVLIRLLMLDRIGQRDAQFQQSKAGAITRLFETTVKLRNMMVSGRGE